MDLGRLFAEAFGEMARGIYDEMQKRDAAFVNAPVSSKTEELVAEIETFHLMNAIDKALTNRDEQVFMQLTHKEESLVVGATNDSVTN